MASSQLLAFMPSCSFNTAIPKSTMLIPMKQQHYRYKVEAFRKEERQKKCSFGGLMAQGSAIYPKSSHELTVCATLRSSRYNCEPTLVMNDSSGEVQRVLSYLFRTEIGGLVKVLVRAESLRYSVLIEVSSLPKSICMQDLVLSWGMFRSDSSQLYVPDFQNSDLGMAKFMSEAGIAPIKTPFTWDSLGNYMIELEFESAHVPFYLSFLLQSSLGAAATESGIKTHRKTNFCVPVGMRTGYPMPLGASISSDRTVNFSLFSRSAEGIVLCLYDGKTSEPSLEIELDSYVNRTGDIWHASMEGIGKYASYGYRCKGSSSHLQNVLLDPYAKMLVNFDPDEGDSLSQTKCLGRLDDEPTFDWSDELHPQLPLEKLVVYRLNVGHFTKDKSSGLPEDVAGTFSGVVEKLQHIKTLGFNAILLEPIFPFDEQKGPYFPYHFFSPANSYAYSHDSVSAINSMKEMVKMLHANGMEVLLEVVFTHTAEGGDAACQAISFGGIDNSSYYVVHGDAGPGASNALKCNSPPVQQMILDSLRYWLAEFHIDGFCFVNASHLIHGSNGENLSRPPLVEAVAFDPLLSRAKIIADCWSPYDSSTKETLFPHWKRWAEMNRRFCNDVRNFLRGEGLLSDLATRLCGSGDVFSDSRGPAFSFNFIAKNFGLPFVDLVSFSNDDLTSELSWNCGEEGPTSNRIVFETRLKQIRNFLFILFISLGIPVLNMGDEFGHSTAGSPFYNDRHPLNWNGLRTGFGIQIMQFISFLSALRLRRSDIFQKRDFLKLENIDWQGSSQSPPKWDDPSCKFLAMTLKAEKNETQLGSDEGNLFICFNASDLAESVILPQLSEEITWVRLVDTDLPFPGFFVSGADCDGHGNGGLAAYEVKPHSCALFEARSTKSESKFPGPDL